MAKQAKRIQAWTGDRLANHAVTDAVKLVKANATAKFDESIEIADNGAEMGVWNLLQQPQREANLALALDEYLRFGLEAAAIFVN